MLEHELNHEFTLPIGQCVLHTQQQVATRIQGRTPNKISQFAGEFFWETENKTSFPADFHLVVLIMLAACSILVPHNLPMLLIVIRLQCTARKAKGWEEWLSISSRRS